jgi:N-acetylneuraminic acid mutarotase
MSHVNTKDLPGPPPLYGHAMAEVPAGFVVFGGRHFDHKPTNDLWLFNLTGRAWIRMATRSNWSPLNLYGHTLTSAGGRLYSFGGSTDHGHVTSILFRIVAATLSDWEHLEIRGLNHLKLRLAGHTSVFHPSSGSLLVYGGVVSDRSNSKLSSAIFSYNLESEKWAELQQNPSSSGLGGPSARAHHTAVVMGDYMVVFGGYNHQGRYFIALNYFKF